MMAIARKIPALRFPEFEGEWGEKRLGEVAVKISDGIHTTPQYDAAGDYFFINGNNLVRGRILLNEKTKRVNKAEYEKHKVVLGENTVLLSINGTIGNLAYYNAEKVILGKSACYINLLKEFSKPFIFNTLQNHKIQRYFSSEVTGSTIMNLSLATIKATKINLPSLPEQQKIATFLSTIDTRIQQLSRKKALLEQYKKGVMQQIFSQEIRFKDEEGKEFPAWEEKRLGEVVTVLRGGSLSKSELSTEGANKCIHYGELFTLYGVVIHNVFSRTNKEEGVRSQAGDILMPTSDVTPNGLATASVIQEDNVLLGGDINILRPKGSINSKALGYLLNFDKAKIIQLVTGTTVKHIYSKDIKTLRLLIPRSEEEQQKIATFLSTLDRQINLVSQQLERMQTFKKGLLQQMFV